MVARNSVLWAYENFITYGSFECLIVRLEKI